MARTGRASGQGYELTCKMLNAATRTVSSLALCLILSGCWANPAAVKISSTPLGAHVWYQQQEVGVTPLETVLACEVNVQFVRVEMPGYPSHDIPLHKRPIRYFVPWFAVVAAGVFTFSTTWRSRACTPEDFTIEMANGKVRAGEDLEEEESKKDDPP